MSGKWITTKEAAELTGYNAEYIRRLVRNKKVVAKKFGPTWQINQESLLEYLQKSTTSGDNRGGPKDL